MAFMKVKDHYFDLTEVDFFYWKPGNLDTPERLVLHMNNREAFYIPGPKTLLGQLVKKLDSTQLLIKD